MQSKNPTKSSFKASVLSTALCIFLSSHGIVNAQAFYATTNMGPGSFSTNWGAAQPGQNERQEIEQRVARARAAAYNRQDVYVGVPDAETSQPAGNSTVAGGPTVPGRRAVLRRGVAYAPQDAPLAVKKAIWAINTIRTKPYVWGGGHDSFFDPRGYDCSGTVSFALHYAGQLEAPTTSQSLMSFGAPGPGRWMTVFARDGHTWMVIAGLRLDTTGYYGNEGPRWRPDGRSSWGFTERHPVGL